MVQSTLFQSNHFTTDEIKVFVGETFNCVVLHSGCNQPVCGKDWLECYTLEV